MESDKLHKLNFPVWCDGANLGKLFSYDAAALLFPKKLTIDNNADTSYWFSTGLLNYSILMTYHRFSAFAKAR